MDKLGALLKTNKWVKIIELLALFLIALIFIKLFIRQGAEYLIQNQLVLWVANLIILGYIWTGIRLRGEALEDFGLSFKRPTWNQIFRTFLWSLLVFVLALAGFVIGSIVMANITGIPENTTVQVYAFLRDNIGMLLATLAGVYVVSSFGEEVIYRAFLINRISELGLSGKWGKFIAIAIAAVIFGLAHYSWGAMGIVQTSLMGLALGICYVYFKKGLWPLILAHAYMDTILIVQMYMASNAT
jgi:membrane protease YdiL (CAAX protease family)